MATKSISSFTILFILLLVIIEVPELKAEDGKCLKEYGGDVGFSFCAPRIFPTICYRRCRQNKGAKGGVCRWGEGGGGGGGGVKCLCDFCSDKPNDQVLSGI